MVLSLLSFSLICSFLLINLSQKYFLSKNYIDSIKDRSSHKSIATRSGGISVFLQFVVESLMFSIVKH